MNYSLISFLVGTVFSTVLTTQEWDIMSYSEYKNVKHSFPYSFSLDNQNRTLFYFGANHSCDPHNRQYPILESFWKDFLSRTGKKDCIVLVEGALRRLRNTEDEAIRGGAEGSYITFLAHKENINVLCPEPDDHEQIKALLKLFDQDVVAYALFAQGVFWEIKAKKVRKNFDFEAALTSYIKENQKYFDTPYTLDSLKQIHLQIFKQPFDGTDENFFYNITNPVDETTIINKVVRHKSMLRDRAIVQFIEDLIKQHKNIFVVYGGTHAVMQEAALRSVWKKVG